MAARLPLTTALILISAWPLLSEAGMQRFWLHDRPADLPQFNECESLGDEQRQQLIAAYQATHDEQKKQELQRRIEWFCQLSADEQQRMRLAWQNMSTQDRLALKKKLDATTDVEKRTQIRREILAKYANPN